MDPNFYKDNPFRPLDWRAQRVMQLLSRRHERPRRYDDRWVRRYWRFLRSLDAAGANDERRSEVLLALNDVSQAHVLYFGSDSHQRQILVARLLTSEPFGDIAKRSGMQTEAVEFFEQVFFCVRDRLHSDDWIRNMALRRPAGQIPENGGLTEAQRGYAYRFSAYYGGPHVLDAVIGGMVVPAMPAGDRAAAGLAADATSRILRVRAFMAALVIDPTTKNAPKLLRLAKQLKKLEPTPEQPDSDSLISARVRAVEEALGISRKDNSRPS